MPRNPDVQPEVVPEIAWLKADAIDGWLTREEANLIYRYAESPWCEVGTYRGRSAAVLALKGRGWSVDFFDGYYAQIAIENLGVLDVIPVQGDCTEVAHLVPDELAFLYLDGDHSYEGTAAAWLAYAPKVRVGGHIALHDALELEPGVLDWPGVNAFVRAVADNENWQLVAAAHRTVVFRRLA